MDDVVSRCRQQLGSFRIRELKDVLARLGLPKQGKKQLLMDKIMGVLVPAEKTAVGQRGGGRGNKVTATREECVNVIDDIYRKLCGAGAPDLASAGKKDLGGGSSSIARSEEPDGAATWGEAKTRCPCGNSKDQGVMIQCDDSKCGVWQHMSCVVIPEKPGEGTDEVPTQFYCELCRINRGDPFCVTLQTPVHSTKLSTTGTKTEGSNPLQNVEKTFQLSLADRDLMHKPNHDLQVWCVLLNDKVPFRMHWPAYADLRINGVSVRVTNRPGQQLLGANGRDEGSAITSYTREGLNRLSFSAYDARPFCLGVRIIRRNSLQQIFAMIPDCSKGEEFEEALVRLRRCINGGGQGAAEDSEDSDLEVVADSVSVNLRCPMSGTRIKVAGRFKPCLHIGCFDLHTFVELNQRARKWQCPICLKNYSLENLIIDPFFSRITAALKHYPEDVTEVELNADGYWRPKSEGEKSREPWRSSDGSIMEANCTVKDSRVLAPLAAVKLEEGLSSQERGPLWIGMKRSHDGQWAVNGVTKRPNGWASSMAAGPSQTSKPLVVPTILPTVISRSSSATDSNEETGEDGERSVNQEPSDNNAEGGHYLEDNEVSYPPKASVTATWPSNRATERQPDASVIVLSDTDDDEADNLILRSSGASVSCTVRPPLAKAAGPVSLDGGIQEKPDEQVLVKIPETLVHVDSIAEGATRGSTSSLENTGTSGGALGLLPDKKNFWSAQMRSSLPYNSYFPSSSDQPASVSAQCNPPVILTAVPALQAVAAAGFDLSRRQHKDEMSRGTSWKFVRSPTPSYSNSDCNGVGSEGGNQASSPKDSPLQLFLPHQPARAQVQPSLQESSIEEVDNSWFSLSLGGADSNADPLSGKRVYHRDPSSAGTCGLDSLVSTASEVFLGMNTNGAHTPGDCTQSKVQGSPLYLSPVNSLSPVPGSPPLGRINVLSPVQVNSPPAVRRRSPAQLHGHRHNYFRVDSDSE